MSCELIVFLHREVLFSRIKQNELNEVLSQVIEMVNFIRTRPMKSRVFDLLCKDMDSPYACLLLHTKITYMLGHLKTRPPGRTAS